MEAMQEIKLVTVVEGVAMGGETTYISMGGPEEGNGNIDESERKPPERPRNLGQLALLADISGEQTTFGGDDEEGTWDDAA
jgi:hypothetical protein